MSTQKRVSFLTLLGACLVLLCGCAVSQNPLEKAEATPVAGLDMELHASSPSESNAHPMQATLYYRYLNEPLLAAETRVLTVRRNESPEMAVVRALLEGPDAGHSDLNRLFPATVRVESVSHHDHVLYVTLNAALLTDDRVPKDWERRDDWMNDAPVLRALTIQSLVATVTEYFPYTGVQVLVRKAGGDQTSLRLDNAYFLNGLSGLSDPQERDESVLLTPQNTADAILSAWQTRDYETLYNFIATVEGGEPKPSFPDVSLRLDAGLSLSAFSVSGGSVSGDGARAVVSARLSLLSGEGASAAFLYPLPLIRENDIWKVTYSQIQALMNP